MLTLLFAQKQRPDTGRLNLLLALSAILIILLAACSGSATSMPTAPVLTPGGAGTSATVSFSKDVLPLLQSRCVNCHGGQKTSKGLNMTSYAKLMAGSQNGAVVIPGNVDKSPFIQFILQGKMPKNGPKLLPGQVQLLINWVKAGALNN